MDDAILGGKADNYCSSSEEEEITDEQSNQNVQSAPALPSSRRPAKNTGPKGVLEDWRRYKQLQSEQKAEKDAECIALAKRLSKTCRTDKEDERAKIKEKETEEIKELTADDDDGFMQKFFEKRIQEIRHSLKPKHNNLYQHTFELQNADDYLKAADEYSKKNTVIIHIYEKSVAGCESMIGCFKCLAKDYPAVRFCQVRASVLNTTQKFKAGALPALQTYRDGILVCNMVRVTDDLGEDFFADELESYLKDYGMLSESNYNNSAVKYSTKDNDSDSDFDLD